MSTFAKSLAAIALLHCIWSGGFLGVSDGTYTPATGVSINPGE